MQNRRIATPAWESSHRGNWSEDSNYMFRFFGWFLRNKFWGLPLLALETVKSFLFWTIAGGRASPPEYITTKRRCCYIQERIKSRGEVKLRDLAASRDTMSLNLKIQREKSKIIFLIVILGRCCSSRKMRVLSESHIFQRMVSATEGQILGSKPRGDAVSQRRSMEIGVMIPVWICTRATSNIEEKCGQHLHKGHRI